MIHRAILGSFERFIGLLIEDFNGAFPLWCAPEQVRILPIISELEEYANSVCAKLEADGLRAIVDARNEKLGLKIRDVTTQKIPYALIVGKKEAEQGIVSVRSYWDGDMGQMAIADVSQMLRDEVAAKTARRKE